MNILITGASNGIGRALALACASSGRYHKIILNGGHDAAALEDTARRVSAAGDLVCIADLGDVGDLSYVESPEEACAAVAAYMEDRPDRESYFGFGFNLCLSVPCCVI